MSPHCCPKCKAPINLGSEQFEQLIYIDCGLIMVWCRNCRQIKNCRTAKWIDMSHVTKGDIDQAAVELSKEILRET